MNKAIITTSWDDGHKLDIRLAALLRKYNIPGTFYISPKDLEIAPEDRLTDAQVKELSQDFEIGAHTMSHPRLTKISDEQSRAELKDSKEYLERVTGKPVTTFCYPGGNYRPEHVEMVREAGYSYARTVERHQYDLGASVLEAPTAVNAYDHYQDIPKILKFARYNPFKVPHLFHWENLAKAMFDKVRAEGGVFHLWSHSWEIDAHGDWDKLEDVLAYISGYDDVIYATNGQLPMLLKPKLLIVTPFFPPETGGVEFYSQNMAQGALANGYDVSVVTSGNAKTIKLSDEAGLHVWRLPRQFKVMNTPINLGWYRTMRRLIKLEQPNIVNVQAPVAFLPDVAMAATRGKNRKRVTTYHAGSMRKGNPKTDWLIGLYENIVLPQMFRRAHKVITSSDYTRNFLPRRYRSDAAVITPGVNIDIFTRRQPKTPGRNILFVGNYRSGKKGLSDLLEAMQYLTNTTLDVVGEGPRKQVENTTYHGALIGQDLVKKFHSADVFVMPSTGITESFGMVLIEAMATGIPIVATRTGGIPKVVTDGVDGLLVPAGKPQQLAEAIAQILDNPSLAKRLADSAYKKVVANYTWEHSITKYVTQLNNLLGRKN